MFSDEIQAELQTLLKGQSLTRKIYQQIAFDQIQENNRDIFYSLLLFTGYLNPEKVNDDPRDFQYNLTIPNQEVKQIYEDRVIQ